MNLWRKDPKKPTNRKDVTHAFQNQPWFQGTK